MLVLGACQSDKVIFNEQQEIAGETWAYDDPVVFTFNVEDTTATYRLLLDVTHRADYQWENFYTRIRTAFPRDSVREDIVSLELAANTGEWYGKCRGDACTVTIALQERVRFAEPGQHSLAFEQYMRENNLRGIQALRLRLLQLIGD